MHTCRLRDFVFCLNAEKEIGECEVKGLATDSRRCTGGFLFFCKGEHFKSEYALNAFENGALAIVCDKKTYSELTKLIPQSRLITVDDITKAIARCAAHFYGYPMTRLCTVAVTGTKGKTTTASFINSALNKESGIKSAILSELVSSTAPRLTTPEAIDFHEAAARALEMKCTHLVCEISSQAQKMMRTYGIIFDYACFLNLGRDHVSPAEHKDKNEYFECKRSLFSMCKTAIINTDDLYGQRILRGLDTSVKAITFSVKTDEADYCAENIKADGYGCQISVRKRGDNKLFSILTSGAGGYNAQNALCAAATLREIGLGKREIFLGIFTGMPRGRGEVITSVDGKINVIVDYAHNEMSFEAMFETVKKVYKCAIVTAIFGCPGGKAECRRGQLARVCALNADKVIVCDDDSGAEGYEKIKEDIQNEFKKACDIENAILNRAFITYVKERKNAVESAVKNAIGTTDKHVILFLGKGDEDRNLTCGCDEKCEKDINLAKEAIKLYNYAFILNSCFFTKYQSIAVALDSSGKNVSAVAAAHTNFRQANMHTFAFCTEEAAKRLEEECFLNGSAVRKISEKEFFYDKARAIKAAVGASKIGILVCFCAEKNVRTLLLKVQKELRAQAVVYLLSNREILFCEKNMAQSISYRHAMLINKVVPNESISLALKALRYGASEAAFIRVDSDTALLRYALENDYVGSIVKKTASP